jgi:hypothetical protein
VRKRLRIAVLAGCGLLLVVVAAVCWLLWAVRQEPEFYRQAVELDQASQKDASDQMLQRATALRSDVEKVGPWQALFTAEQINGWLAVDLVENHPGTLPESFRDPRVEIRPEKMTVAWRVEQGRLAGVVSFVVEPYVPEPNVLALRIRAARAGLVPIPLSDVLDGVSRAAGQMDFTVRWQQADGDPVALVTIPPPSDQADKVIEIETIRLGEGEIYLSGRTRRR